MSLWVPPKVARNLVEERQASQMRALLYQHTNDVCEEFTRELRKIDPLMQMVFFPEPMPLDVVAAGGRPGRYNIIRESHKGGPVTYMPVLGDNDEFVEPTSRIFEQLQRMDWWNPEVRRERDRTQAKLVEAREKREAEERRRRNEVAYERYLNLTRASVSMADTGWSNKVKGRRGANSK